MKQLINLVSAFTSLLYGAPVSLIKRFWCILVSQSVSSPLQHRQLNAKKSQKTTKPFFFEENVTPFNFIGHQINRISFVLVTNNRLFDGNSIDFLLSFGPRIGPRPGPRVKLKRSYVSTNCSKSYFSLYCRLKTRELAPQVMCPNFQML